MNNLSQVVEILREMHKLELLLSKLYEHCADIFPKFKDLWLGLQTQEIDHAKHIEEIISLVDKKPDEFKPNSAFTIAALKMIQKGIEDHIEKVKNKEYSERKILFIAKDIESSVIENKFFTLLASENKEFNDLISKIKSETENHRQELENKIREYVSGKP